MTRRSASAAVAATDGSDAIGVAFVRRSSVSALARLIFDPLKALPPEVFVNGLVLSRVAGRNRVYITDPGLIHETLVRNADCLSKGDEIRRVLGPALGNGLLTSDGPTWKWQRQSMAPAFQHDKLLGFLPAMIAAAEQTRDRWLEAAPDAVIDIDQDLMGTTFEIIVETMLSGPGQIDAALIERSVTDYLRPTNWMLALAILKAPLWVPYPGRRRAETAAAAMRKAVLAMVASRRAGHAPEDHAPEDRTREDRQPEDLVALLLAAADPETGRSMTDTEITDNLLTFINAGHETTALGLSWTLMLLAAHRDIEAKLRREIDTVTAGGPVKPEHIERLTYTRQVFSEAMRLYPPAPLLVRTAVKDFVLAGESIAAGTMIALPVYAVHRHTRLWEEPERFDPERFAPARVKTRHRFAFMPFGAGNRICIGGAFATMEAVAILAVLLRSVRLDPVRTVMPSPSLRVTLRPSQKHKARVSPRA